MSTERLLPKSKENKIKAAGLDIESQNIHNNIPVYPDEILKDLKVEDKKFKNAEELLDTITYGKQHYIIITLCMLIISIEGIHLSAVSYLLIPLEKMYQTSITELEFTAAAVFLGQGLGSLMISILKVYFTRRTLILSSLVGMSVIQFLLISSTSLIPFSIYRMIIGALLGISYPLMVNITCEYLPIKYRSLIMNSLYIGFSTGQIIMLLTMLLIMPNYEINQFSNLMYCIWIYILIVTIIFFIWFEDSPRNLIFNDEIDTGIKIYKKMLNDQGIKYNEELTNEIVDYIKSGDNKLFESNYSSLFKNNFFRLTMLLILVWIFNSFIRYGPILIYSTTLKIVSENSNKYIIISNLVTSLITLILCFIFAWISEKPTIGLIKISQIVFTVSAVFSVLAIIDKSLISIWMSLFYAVVNSGNSSINTYTSLVYPTKIRDTSYGFFNFLKRVCAFSSQFIFLDLFSRSVMIPYYFLFFLNISMILALLFLPFDPSKSHLDQDLCTELKLDQENKNKTNNQN